MQRPTAPTPAPLAGIAEDARALLARAEASAAFVPHRVKAYFAEGAAAGQEHEETAREVTAITERAIALVARAGAQFGEVFVWVDSLCAEPNGLEQRPHARALLRAAREAFDSVSSSMGAFTANFAVDPKLARTVGAQPGVVDLCLTVVSCNAVHSLTQLARVLALQCGSLAARLDEAVAAVLDEHAALVGGRAHRGLFL